MREHSLDFQDFKCVEVVAGATRIGVRHAGKGRPLLLLHGFPQSLLMWRDVAPQLARHFCVVCADLRGYGTSSCPPSTTDHAPYAKRTMAADMVKVMAALGHDRFGVVGHDRGGRVAYRLALDHPERIEKIVVLDVVPTAEVWARADHRIAAYWPWVLLAQPAPLPERLLVADPGAIVDNALDQWGSSADVFDQATRDAYVAALGDPAHAHAICEEYRAGAADGLDVAHDHDDLAAGRRIRSPLLVLWSATGALQAWYSAQGGPGSIWRRYADDVQAEAVPGGHFFPEEDPIALAARLKAFFAS